MVKLGAKKGVVIASINVNSLFLHLDEIKCLVKVKDVHILALNETKLDKDISDRVLEIEGYSFERLDRNRNGGGVAIYCRNTFECSKRDDIPISILEMICVEIKPPKAKPYLVLSWYRPPSATIETFENLERVLRLLESEDKETILLGDTNCDFSNKTPESSRINLPNNINRLADLYNSFGLTQLISEPTRETIDTSTIIDHIAVNVECNIIESGVLKLALSDHCLVYAIRKFRGNIPCNHKMIKTRQMKNFNEELFLKDLVNVDWQQILTCSQEINVVVQNWTNMLSLIIEKHAPLRERRASDKFAPWLTPDLMNMFRTRDRLKAAAIKSKSVLLMEAYKEIWNKANALNTRLKKSYFTDKIHSCEGNIKETWTTINKLINKRSKKTRQMKNFNEELFLKDLVNVDWQQILTCSQEINVVVQNWTNMLSLIIEKHAPLRERRASDKFAPWLTPDLMNMFRTRDRLKAAAIKSKSVLLMEAYKEIWNKANALNTRLKKSYFTDKIHSCEGNIKETWTTINKLINKRSKTTNITSLRVDDETISKPDLIAESMNKYFCSVGEQLCKKIPKKMNSSISSQILAPESNFSFSPVNAEDLT